MNDRQVLRSKSVAGVMSTARGRSLVFALFVNDVPLPAGVTPIREGKALGRLCEILYESVP
jgi:D-alanyl-D-alanine carboxypeptidase/D-alanyl-D-alanine-endopeptidase (penicillin-binding protein 4)